LASSGASPSYGRSGIGSTFREISSDKARSPLCAAPALLALGHVHARTKGDRGRIEGFADSSGTPRRGAATDRTWQRDPAADLARVAWGSESDLGNHVLRQDASVVGPAQLMTVSPAR